MPSINALSAALLACAGSAVATQFTLTDTYDHTNFFDKFTFNDQPDTNSGFVVYQNQANAVSQGLAKITSNNEVYLGVDHSTVLKGAGFPGRNSLRLESKASYKHGLIVARFTHLPANRCGSWPSFWTLGDSWPNDGEIDVYEGWNNIVNNQPAFHVGDTKTFGQCILESAGQTAPVATSNCDNTFQSPPTQFLNQGCTATDGNGPWASSNGGTYAIEWTSDYIKLYNWARGSEPANLASSSPDTSTWGTPAVNLQNSNCNIDSHFSSQRLILDIDFCGNPVGTPAFWEQGCSAATSQATCADYVAKFPGDFAESFFQIQDIRYFTEGASQPATSSKPASSSAAASSSVAASSSAVASSSVEASSVAATSAASSAVAVPTSVIASQPGSPLYPVPENSTSAYSVLPTGGAGYPVPSSGGSSGPETITTDITIVHTITSCAPEVTNCPARHSTQVIHTTLPAPQPTGSASPVVTAGAPAPSSGVPGAPGPSYSVPEGPAPSNGPSGPETITTAITVVHTITSCAPEVTNCPARHSTEIIHTTYPAPQPTGVASPPAPPVAPAPAPSVEPAPSVAPVPVPSYLPLPPAASAPASPVAPAPAPSSEPGSPAAPAPAPSGEPAPPASPVPVPSYVPVPPAASAPASPIAPAPAPITPGNSTASTLISVPTGQAPTPSNGAGCTGLDCLPLSGAARTGMSTLALVGAVAVMLL
ncbi:hypothetical protein MKX07_001706 [Trichoderma sp. CBMAI-0711]|nr:hypothetical protein MKX07_001706 [Trichoderma sp. CBMAI-0711]